MRSITKHFQIRKCECNQLTDLHLLDDTSQDNVLNILSKWHCTCGKKVRGDFTYNYICSLSET